MAKKNLVGERCVFPITILRKFDFVNVWQEGIIVVSTDNSIGVKYKKLGKEEGYEYRVFRADKVMILKPAM